MIRTDEMLVAVVDDDAAVARSIEAILSFLDVRIKCFPSAEEFKRSYVPGQVACLLLDYVLPGASGLELLSDLKDDKYLQVIMVSGKGSISTAVTAMKTGAVEFLEKPYSHDSLKHAVEMGLQRYRQLRQEYAWEDNRLRRLATLTDAERQVIEASATGDTVKVIASRLDISVRTVHMRLASAMKKTQTTNKMELINLAMTHRN